MIQELLKAFLLIFIAEMGDKTQILAMAFATKYPVKKVLSGIFIGVLINHGIAVFLGNYVSSFIPIKTVQIIAGIAFIGFALWTLKYEDEEDEEGEQKLKLGPTLTVAAAFFIGELGDKTQLSAITLAAGASYPLAILTGTVSGMLVTGGMGIFVGKKLGDRIPEFAIKLIAACIFLIFGISKLYQNLPSKYLNGISILVFSIVLGAIVFYRIRKLIVKRQEGKETALARKSRELYEYYHKIETNVENMCLGVGSCGECQGVNCVVGHTKAIIKNGLDEGETRDVKAFVARETNKQYDRSEALASLRMTLELIKGDPNNESYREIHQIRKNLERILFGRSIEEFQSWEDYQKKLQNIDADTAGKIFTNEG